MAVEIWTRTRVDNADKNHLLAKYTSHSMRPVCILALLVVTVSGEEPPAVGLASEPNSKVDLVDNGLNTELILSFVVCQYK